MNAIVTDLSRVIRAQTLKQMKICVDNVSHAYTRGSHPYSAPFIIYTYYIHLIFKLQAPNRIVKHDFNGFNVISNIRIQQIQFT